MNIRLSDFCQVKLDDPNQWILQVRGDKKGKFGNWESKSFCTQRATLLRDIREKIIAEGGEVDPEAMAAIGALPERFPYKLGKETEL